MYCYCLYYIVIIAHSGLEFMNITLVQKCSYTNCDKVIIIIFNMTSDNKILAGSLELFHELWTTGGSSKIQQENFNK